MKFEYSYLNDANFFNAANDFHENYFNNFYTEYCVNVEILNELAKQINTNICIFIDKYRPTVYDNTIKNTYIYIQLPDKNYKHIIDKSLEFLEANKNALWNYLMKSNSDIEDYEINVYFMISKNNLGYGYHMDCNTDNYEYIPGYVTEITNEYNTWSKLDFFSEHKFWNNMREDLFEYKCS